MFLEETSRNPLINGHSNDTSEIQDSDFVIFVHFSLLDSLEEESGEGLKGVLVHWIDDAELNKQEIEHGTFSSNSSVHFSQEVNLDFSVFGN